MIVRLSLATRQGAGYVGRVQANAYANDIIVNFPARMPFADSTVDEIRTGRALSYVEDLRSTMEELWRIGKSGALLYARLPHASSTWGASQDPALKRAYTLETFRYFSPDSHTAVHAAFELERAALHLKRPRLQSPGVRAPAGVLASVVDAMANRSRAMQYRWERWFGPLIGGFEEFSIVLNVVKAPPIH